jgi:predicted transcriptional regulator
MHRKTAYITEDQNRRLKQLATEHGVSRNALIRRALDRYLEKASLSEDPADQKDQPARS